MVEASLVATNFSCRCETPKLVPTLVKKWLKKLAKNTERWMELDTKGLRIFTRCKLDDLEETVKFSKGFHSEVDVSKTKPVGGS